MDVIVPLAEPRSNNDAITKPAVGPDPRRIPACFQTYPGPLSYFGGLTSATLSEN